MQGRRRPRPAFTGSFRHATHLVVGWCEPLCRVPNARYSVVPDIAGRRHLDRPSVRDRARVLQIDIALPVGGDECERRYWMIDIEDAMEPLAPVTELVPANLDRDERVAWNMGAVA